MSKRIVDVIIGDMLFHPDDMDGISKARDLSLFKLCESSDDDVNSGEEYSVVIKTPKRFSLLIGTIALGASFRMAARIVQLVRDESGLSFYSGCSDIMASNYARVACAAALEIVAEALNKTGGFSLALDVSTLHGMSYLDVRVRFFLNCEMYNFHVLAIPLFDRHTGLIMFEALAKFFDALFPEWRNFLVGVSSDGDRSMTGRIQGVLTRLAKESLLELFKIWCGLHQFDLLMQRVYSASLDEEFYSTLTGVIGHLRRQQNLITEMRSTCPKVGDTRWVSMDDASGWLTKHVVVLTAHFDAKRPRCTPDKLWWLFLFVIRAFAQESMLVFVSLQGLTTLVSQQKATLLGLIDTYCRMTGMTGPHQEDELQNINQAEAEIAGGFVLTHAHARQCIDGISPWVLNAIETLPEDEVKQLVVATAKLFVETAHGITQIVVERDASNNAGSELPPVLPKQLMQIDLRAFMNMVARQRPRLKIRMSESEIEEIGVQFASMKRAYREEPGFRNAVDACDDIKSDLVAGWAAGGAADRFGAVREFCGSLASVFPNTATVESDFSIIGWEKDVYRKRLTDFSLEGILHCKQFSRLRALQQAFARL